MRKDAKTHNVTDTRIPWVTISIYTRNSVIQITLFLTVLLYIDIVTRVIRVSVSLYLYVSFLEALRATHTFAEEISRFHGFKCVPFNF